MKRDLVFDPPLMNAAGSLGFAPGLHGAIALERLGAFVTNPVSLGSRSPAHSLQRCMDFPGGFLLHTGHPNPGLSKTLRLYAPRWARSPRPVLVHLLGQSPEEVRQMARRLEGVAGVSGLEIGLPPGVDGQSAVRFVEAATGELPVVVRLPLERAPELAAAILVGEPAPVAFSLGPPRGLLPGPARGLLSGRLYGPAVFPQALAALHALVRLGVPVIGAGGIYHEEQIEVMLAAGAVAVQLDAVLWR